MSNLIDRGITELEDLGIEDLRDRWQAAYGKAPPPRMSRDLLLRALAYWLQERSEGGLKKTVIRKLKEASRSKSKADSVTPLLASHLKPGTRLVREWHGKTHQVTVLDKGFDYGGKSFPSLSAIAREITGTRWSGPRFFGLRKGRGGWTDNAC